MIHLNGNVLCVVDCETTGLDPMNYDMWQFCCVPLNFALKPDKKRSPFDIKLKPQHIENRQPNAISKRKFNDAVLYGMDYEVAANLFNEWFERLGLGLKKRIVPLAQNWPFDRGFIIEWLGPDAFEYYFDPRYRDTMVAAAFVNDVCDHTAEAIPFPGVSLRRLACCMDIEWDHKSAHDAFYDSVKTAEVYRQMILKTRYIQE